MSTKKQIQMQLVRALADYDNLRKRGEVEKEIWLKFSSERILTKLLPILDMLESAQDYLKDSGLAIGLTEFRKIIEEEGLEEIKPQKGEVFDEGCQEAVEVVKGDKKDDNKVSEVVLSGWKYTGGQVIRHAKVKVSKDDTNIRKTHE